MINITSPMQESICLDSFFGVTRILDTIFDELSDDKGSLEAFNEEFEDYVYENFSAVDFLYPIMNVKVLDYRSIKNLYLKKINMDTSLNGQITHNYLQENLCFITMGDYKSGKIHIYNGNNCLSMDEVNAVGIDPSSCELIYDKPLVPPKMASFNNRVLGITHGVFFAAMEVEAYSESSIFTGYKHPDISKKKLFNLGDNNPIYNSKYINLYIGQWKLDKAGRNIYELEAKTKFDVDKKDRKEFEKTFNDILSGGNGEITIKITGSDKYYEKSV